MQKPETKEPLSWSIRKKNMKSNTLPLADANNIFCGAVLTSVGLSFFFFFSLASHFQHRYIALIWCGNPQRGKQTATASTVNHVINEI